MTKNKNIIPLVIACLSLIYFQGNVWSMIIGFLISAAGLSLRRRSAGYINTSGKFVTSGPFAHSQNPHFVGNILLYSGIAVMSFALFPFFQILIPVLLYLYYRSLASVRAKELKSSLGDQYELYASKVPLAGWRMSAFGIGRNGDTYDSVAGKTYESGTRKAFAAVTVTFLIIWLVRIF